LLDLDVKKNENKIISGVSSKNYPEAKEYIIPGDISSAMYFIVLTLLIKNSELKITNVSLNATRIAAIELLIKMGAEIEIDVKGASNRESYGDLNIKSSELKNVQIEEENIPLLIDEISIIAVAGIFAHGEFKINNAPELRVKESDRIKSMCDNFLLLGLDVKEFDDGLSISGQIKNQHAHFKSFNDHRIAMTFSILSCLLDAGGSVEGFDSVSISNPDFFDQLKKISR
jgi:3-phosphoshikimate 1-carboxyvinyltransferase